MPHLENLEANPGVYYERLANATTDIPRRLKFVELATLVPRYRAEKKEHEIMQRQMLSNSRDFNLTRYLALRRSEERNQFRIETLMYELDLNAFGIPKEQSKDMRLCIDSEYYLNPSENLVLEKIVTLCVGNVICLELDNGRFIDAVRDGETLWYIHYHNAADDNKLYDSPADQNLVQRAFSMFYKGDEALGNLLPWKKAVPQPVSREERLRQLGEKIRSEDEGEAQAMEQLKLKLDLINNASDLTLREMRDLEPDIASVPTQTKIQFEPTESIEGDGKTSGIAIDKRNNMIGVWSNFNREIVAACDIVSSEVCVDGATVIKSDFMSLLGRAAVGGFLFAGVGAILGGLSASKRKVQNVTKVELKVLTKNTRNAVHNICFYEKGVWGWATVESGIKDCGHWHDILTVAMKEAADSAPVAQSVNAASPSETLPMQLAKLAELHRDGAITETEFKRAKEKLLS